MMKTVNALVQIDPDHIYSVKISVEDLILISLRGKSA